MAAVILLQGELTGLCLRCGLACEGLMRIALWLRANERPAVSPAARGSAIVLVARTAVARGADPPDPATGRVSGTLADGSTSAGAPYPTQHQDERPPVSGIREGPARLFA